MNTGALIHRPTVFALVLGVMAIALGLLRYGVGAFPSWEYLHDIAVHWQDPGRAPLMEANSDYLKGNATTAWMAGALGLLGKVPYFGFQLAWTIAALLIPFLAAPIRRDPDRARIVFVVLAGGALLPVMLGWIGGYDALTVIGVTIAATSRARRWLALGWFLVALNHPGIAAMCLVAWAPLAVALMRDRRRLLASHLGVAVAAVVVGAVINGRIVAAWGGAHDRLTMYLWANPWHYVTDTVANWPVMLFTVLGVAWLVVLHPGIRTTTTGRILIAEAVIVSIVVPVLIIDATRDAALIMLAPLLAWAAFSDEAKPLGAPSHTWQLLAIAAAITPIPVIWEAQVHLSTWSSIAHIQEALTPVVGGGWPS